MENKTIYVVTTEGDVEGRSIRTLGYVTGEVADIETFFNDRKTYELSIRPLEVKHISATSAAERRKLIEEKKKLEQRLESINKAIK